MAESPLHPEPTERRSNTREPAGDRLTTVVTDPAARRDEGARECEIVAIPDGHDGQRAVAPIPANESVVGRRSSLYG